MIYRFCRFLLRMLYAVLFRLKSHGTHHVPESGGVLLCSNHISLLDPPTVGIHLKRRVHFMAKAELFAFKPLGALFRSLGAYPVKRGGVSKDAIKTSLQLLRDGHVMGIFPEGTRNMDDASAAKKGAAMIALRSGAAVVPCRIVGSYKLFRTTHVIYGPPIDLTAFQEAAAGADSLEKATELIMERIRALNVG